MRLKYVDLVRARGRVFAYYRRDGYRVRIRGEIGSPEFLSEYQRIHAAAEREARPAPGAGTLAALIASYKASTEFRELAPRTRHDYQVRGLDFLAANYGAATVSTITRAAVFKLRDLFADRPRKARYLVQIFSTVMRFAIAREWRTDNPAAGVRLPKRGPGYQPWTAHDVDAVLSTAEPELRLAIGLGLYTAQRAGDVCRLTWNVYDGEGLTLTQGKTGRSLWIPCARPLKAALDAAPRRAVTILVTAQGRAFDPKYLAKRLRWAVAAAGRSGISFHGLRKSATGALAAAGCTEAEIMAVTGHSDPAMVAYYIGSARQRERATAAICKLDRNTPATPTAKHGRESR